MRTLTEQEMREIAARVPVPKECIAGLYVVDGVTVAGLTHHRDGLKEGSADANGVMTPPETPGACRWTVAMLAAIDEARAKPALVELPDVSDLPGVMLSRDGVDRVYVQVATDGDLSCAVLARQPDGEWDVFRPLSYTDALFAAGRVAERLNQQERDR